MYRQNTACFWADWARALALANDRNGFARSRTVWNAAGLLGGWRERRSSQSWQFQVQFSLKATRIEPFAAIIHTQPVLCLTRNAALRNFPYRNAATRIRYPAERAAMYCLPNEQEHHSQAEMIIMATSTYNASVATPAKADPSKPGILSKFIDRIVDVQTAKARGIIADYLSGVSDQELLSYGWEPADIKRLRNR